MQSPSGIGSRTQASSRFRVVCHHADGSVGLLTLCQTLSGARTKARREVDQHLARLRSERLAVLLDAKRPTQIRVEQWIGEATSGAWKVVERREGGYEFTFHDSPPRKFRGKNSRESDSVSFRDGHSADLAEKSLAPQSGDLVECVLLERRTRRNGWFAKVATLPISGPVTGPAPHGQALEPGMKIVLRVCSCKLSTAAAQFAWQ